MWYFLLIFISFFIICLGLNVVLSKRAGKKTKLSKHIFESFVVALIVAVLSIMISEMIII